MQTREDLLTKLQQAQVDYRWRDQLITLCREMYEMQLTRKSGYLSKAATDWRTKVAPEYWQASSKPHNVVDIATAVLSGHPPQFRATIPDNPIDGLASRAEKFLLGVLSINSMRQQSSLPTEIAFRTILDGGVGVRVTWDAFSPDPDIMSVQQTDPEATPWDVAVYDMMEFPVILEVVPLDNLFPVGRGARGEPFRELFHVEERIASDVLHEWHNAPMAQLAALEGLTQEELRTTKAEYVEWWGYDDAGDVYFAVLYDKKLLIPPQKTNYPLIPYVITTFKEYDKRTPERSRLPFLFPIIHATDKEEYLASRTLRLIDLYANLPPVKRGGQPVNVSGTWGEVLHFTDPNERLEFMNWPGQPPDVYRALEEAKLVQSQGTFSDAMFGQVSSRISGYGLSQLIGADTLRLDTPRQNLELGYARIAYTIFKLMQEFSPVTHLATTAHVRGTTISALLSGEETKRLFISANIKPKQQQDEIRLATIGAQLAALPRKVVSLRYILENYFGLAQPEDELARVRYEEALDDPMVRMMALLDVLRATESEYVPIVQAQLQKLVEQANTPPAPAGGMEQLGLGLPQAVGGNPPQQLPPGVNPSAPTEAGLLGQEAALFGGPRE